MRMSAFATGFSDRVASRTVNERTVGAGMVILPARSSSTAGIWERVATRGKPVPDFGTAEITYGP